MTRDPEKTAEKLLKALRTADPSWNLRNISVCKNPLDTRSPYIETLSLFQGDRRFCRGFDVDGLLLDFVECCRDGCYSVGCGWHIPGTLRDAVDPDDLAFRLCLLRNEHPNLKWLEVSVLVLGAAGFSVWVGHVSLENLLDAFEILLLAIAILVPLELLFLSLEDLQRSIFGRQR